MNNINKSRIKKELEMFSSSPPSGITCVALDDERLDTLSAQIIGASGTPFEGGTFQLEVQITDRYPFEPPRIRFITPIYHPNIDKTGRICMDTLKVPPKGTWGPCLNISTVLMMIRVLMGEPGSEDPLMTDIWQEFKYDYTSYAAKAKQWTQLHAMQQKCLTEKDENQPSEVQGHCSIDTTSCGSLPETDGEQVCRNINNNNSGLEKENQKNRTNGFSGGGKKRKLRLHKAC